MEFIDFVKEFIRGGGYCMNWLEQRKYELAPLFKSRLNYLLSGKTFVLMTDDKRSWFEDYFLKNINSNQSRPLLPFVSMKSLGVDYKNLNSDVDSLNDLLDIVFPNGYIYFYIGSNGGKMANIAKSKDDSFIWLFDEQLSNSLYLSSNDKEVDIKLLTLFMLFDACVDAVVFSRVKF